VSCTRDRAGGGGEEGSITCPFVPLQKPMGPELRGILGRAGRSRDWPPIVALGVGGMRPTKSKAEGAARDAFNRGNSSKQYAGPYATASGGQP